MPGCSLPRPYVRARWPIHFSVLEELLLPVAEANPLPYDARTTRPILLRRACFFLFPFFVLRSNLVDFEATRFLLRKIHKKLVAVHRRTSSNGAPLHLLIGSVPSRCMQCVCTISYPCIGFSGGLSLVSEPWKKVGEKSPYRENITKNSKFVGYDTIGEEHSKFASPGPASLLVFF